MRAFIVRPFGTKEGINFEEVEQKLIDPALRRLGIEGRTTVEIARQGNIRLDMFQRLLTADIVIADISIHNANVFYELGIRHALRDKRTFLLREQLRHIPKDDPQQQVPFDLRTDRYLAYSKDDPGATLEALTEGLRESLDSERPDSPVFQLLPGLEAQDRSRFLPVPFDFSEDVRRAARSGQKGDLGLLASEVKGLEWEIEGLRVVGREQFNLKAFEGARSTWEAVRKIDPFDVEANTLLGTIFHRLGDLESSDDALDRALARKGLGNHERAEVRSLKGRNAKTRWREEWAQVPAEQRAARALGSRYLGDSFDHYAGAFGEDLNHFYSGLNALAMLAIQTELAAKLPDVWLAQFDEDEEAERDLEKRRERRRELAAAVSVSLDAFGDRLRRENKSPDIWAEISGADLCLLTSDRARRVASTYQKALAGAPDFAVGSARDQVRLYQELGVLTGNVEAALSVMNAPEEAAAAAVKKQGRVLLFTGHMVDAEGRATPRFPRTEEAEEEARAAIRAAVEEEMKEEGGVAVGYAGGASGGDLLFHEVCAELEIPTHLYLAIPAEKYVAASVQPAGREWVERFWHAHAAHEGQKRLRVLCGAEDVKEEREYLPIWLRSKPDYGIWQRNNLWMLHNALAVGGARSLSLIALWDEKETGDGPGGTSDLVRKVRERGSEPVIINTKQLFKL